ncbi:glycosyltransferase family 1 protein [Pseudomonas capeferrum]|uniref:glycosyltransferase n=1 Tax=Pseudomonas capeferrum TaxID=1495066 RepID=UPI0015E42D8D|nr:glycosyltransferase [Pseudomonas capeferrum]MBA1204101.1 glycosyltransferase family 1 protein [Pseudomonas capeferrum]
MSHFAVVAPAYPSHFQAFEVLAGELLARGHQVTFFHQADTARWISDSRIGLRVVGQASHPPGSLDRQLRLAASPGTPWGLWRLIRQLAATNAMFCAELPRVLAEQRVDAMLCDQMEGAGGLVAEALGLPFVSVACALPINREPGLPLPVMPFAYGKDERSLRLCQGSTQVHDWLMTPLAKVLEHGARQLGLPPRRGLHQYLSPLAQLSQTVPAFDFPRQALPAHCHGVGPLRRTLAESPGPWPIDARRPFIFASLGTLQGGRLGMFEQIARACRCLGAQLLIAHCGSLGPAQEAHLQRCGATWVTDFAPQRWALAQADAVVTHGGLNTVLDAIAARTPMLVMPIAFDQQGVAARVEYHGIGVRLSRRAGAADIALALDGLLKNAAPRLEVLGAELDKAGGAPRAADIIESVVRQGQPIIAGACNGP